MRRSICLVSFIYASAFKLVFGSPDLPNIVMIMADDIGWSDIAAYRLHQGLDNPIPTPAIDRLVSEGMMFTDAHSAASVCSPTRFSMLTGSYPYRNGRPWGTWGFPRSSALTTNRKHTTVAEIARQAGYRNAFIGKMHIGASPRDKNGHVTFEYSEVDYTKQMKDLTLDHGFDYSYGSLNGIQGRPYLYLENDHFLPIHPGAEQNESLTDFKDTLYPSNNGTGEIEKEGIGDMNWNSSQTGILYSDKAVEFIKEHVAQYPERPFLLYYMSQAVHTPHTPPTIFKNNVDERSNAEPVAGITGGSPLADMIYELNLQVDKIISQLEDPNSDGDTQDSLLRNTLIFFTSDNGGLAQTTGFDDYDSTGVLRGHKGEIWEGGHRVPFIARWGDGTEAGSKIKPGSVSNALVSNHDWVGTVYALTQQSMQANQAMDTINLLPILRGEVDVNYPLRNTLLQQSHKSKKEWFSLRRGSLSLIFNRKRNPIALFDLATDLQQEKNLIRIPEYKQTIQEMEATFKKYDSPTDPRSTERLKF